MANVASFEFVDIDHFREQLRGWDTPAIQVERGQISIRLHSIDLGGLIFSDIQVNRKVIDHSRPHGDWLKCVINLSPAIFCGFEVAAGHLVILAPGREYRSILANSWHSIEIVASLSLLADEGLTPAPYLLSGPENAIVLLRPELVGIFRNLAEATFGRSANGRIDDLRLRSALLRALDKAFAMGARQVSDHRRRAEGHELTHRVLRFVESRFGRRITVEEVACELDVTTRALHYAVRSTLGISPLELILALRLNHVRNHLWETRSSEPNITTAALAQDFGHLGRFSQQYCALFGELPSRTVRRIRSLTS